MKKKGLTTKEKDQIIRKLKRLLQIAIELEHATMPAYLYAYWSVIDRSSLAASVLFSIVKEEMLHLAMVANILNAIGGRPKIKGPKFIPKYPAALPGHDQTNDSFLVSLDRFSIEAVANFMHIELPRKYAKEPIKPDGWETIGDFYVTIIHIVKQLENEDFSYGKQALHRDAPSHSGHLISVWTKKDALLALNEIIEQGEGLGSTKKDELGELAHFFRLVDLYQLMGGLGEIDYHAFNEENLAKTFDKKKYSQFETGIIPVVKNPRENNPSRTDVQIANLKFNAEYSKILDKLHAQFGTKEPNLEYTVNSMFSLSRYARALMSTPVDPNDISKGFCGPTFDYLKPKERVLNYKLD
ncbi:MAG: ferritin-like protein [Saprospiraceae bacterium]|nr:ferritin-like protein [Saprospiraceae bacterium]